MVGTAIGTYPVVFRGPAIWDCARSVVPIWILARELGSDISIATQQRCDGPFHESISLRSTEHNVLSVEKCPLSVIFVQPELSSCSAIEEADWEGDMFTWCISRIGVLAGFCSTALLIGLATSAYSISPSR
jgi:hypothetical protein